MGLDGACGYPPCVRRSTTTLSTQPATPPHRCVRSLFHHAPRAQAIGEAHFGSVSCASNKKTKKTKRTKAGTTNGKAPCFGLMGYRFGLLMALCAMLIMPSIIHATFLAATVVPLPVNGAGATESMLTRVRISLKALK